MNHIDWIVLVLTLAFIVLYGTYKTRNVSSLDDYIKGGKGMSWFTIGLSVMATQASAITFISTPGLAFDKGMAFVQNYFGLPLALIVVSAFFIPIYYKLKVYTAYEYLEHRFDLRMRLFTSFLFLLQRGLAAGITIYAPAIILHTALGWDLNQTILAVGILVIIYTVSGGTRAVSVTQKWQMSIILLGMAGVFIYLIYLLTRNFSFDQNLLLAGKMGKMEVVSFSFDTSERYTFWTGITGGFFLALSYFGTDQSQVQRYLSGKGIRESRLGLMFNALFKIPMQFFILLTGVLVFLFFEFNDSPLMYNQTAYGELSKSKASEIQKLEEEHKRLKDEKMAYYTDYLKNDDLKALYKAQHIDGKQKEQRTHLEELSKEVLEDGASARESDYVFLYFILNYLPHGIIGLLLCVIISAAMSSTAGEINALAATTTIDYYQRLSKEEIRPKRALLMSKAFTLLWGVFAILFALFAHLAENLIEAVNILGSLFYGTILGVFMVGLFNKIIDSKSIFIAALSIQCSILLLYFFKRDEIAYLWYNLIACLGVITLAWLLHFVMRTSDELKE